MSYLAVGAAGLPPGSPFQTPALTAATSGAGTARKSQDVVINTAPGSVAYADQVAAAQVATAAATASSSTLRTVLIGGGLVLAAGVGYHFWKKRKRS